MATTFPLDQFGWRLQLSIAADGPSGDRETSIMIARVRAGDLDAFDLLMRMEERRVYRTALHLLGRPEDAEDAVQEIFLRVHRRLQSYDPERPWRSWLYAVAVNVCRDMGRKRRWRTWISLDAWREGGGPEPAAVAADLDWEVELERRRAILKDGMKRLSSREREVLTLYAIEELSAAEAAAVLGVAEGTVRSIASQARAKLSKYAKSRLGGRR